MSSFYEMPKRSNELYHHGVIGMKWGVHRANKLYALGKHEKARAILDRTYQSSSKRLSRMDKKITKLQTKATKYRQISDRNKYGFLGSDRKAAKFDRKSGKKQYKANKQAVKAQKFVKQMEQTYKNTNIKKLSPEQLAMGKKYQQMLTTRSQAAM